MAIGYNGFSSNSAIQLPNSYSDVLSYIKKRLGEPVIKVNLSDEQIYDRIGDALQFFKEWNEDGTEKQYVTHYITEDDVNSRTVPVANNVVDVIRVFHPLNIDKNIMTDITYNIRHQLNFSEFMTSTYSGSFTEYNLLQMKIQEITDMFQPEKGIRFNRYTSVLHWDEDFQRVYDSGDFLVYEAYVLIDPEVYNNVLTDRKFLGLATAYTKRLWGEVLTLFTDTPLLGGLKLNGNAIFQSGSADCEKFEEMIRRESNPPGIFIG